MRRRERRERKFFMGKMVVSEIKAKSVFAGPGMSALVAEAVVYDDETGDEVFVTVQDYEGMEYTVAEKSVYAFLAEDQGEPVSEFLEEYTKAEDAKKSAYAKVFDGLKKAMKVLG